MKLLVAILAVLALVGSAMAWELSDDLQYTYVKTAYQQAGDSFILPAIVGAESDAHFYNPCVEIVKAGTAADYYPGSGTGTIPGVTEVIPASAAEITNKLGSATVDRLVWYPQTDMTNADFSAQLTQGGSASVALHSQINDQAAAIKYALTKVADTPEMQGTANAYQNLALAGGFDEATASFDSAAAVGVDKIFARTFTTSSNYVAPSGTLTANSASVNSEAHGGGMIESANLGEQVTADIVKSFPGSGWATPEYSGGIKMWADFVACDPGCTNPVVASVNGQSWTAIFPGVDSSSYGASSNGYWAPFSTGTATLSNPNIAAISPFHI